MSTKRTYMDLPRSDMQRRALRALVTLCLVFFAGAILVLTSFATPALADENSYNSENIASAGAGSNGVVVMAPAAAPQQAAPAAADSGSGKASRAAALAIPIPASAPEAAAPVAFSAAPAPAAAEAVQPESTPSVGEPQTNGSLSDSPAIIEAPGRGVRAGARSLQTERTLIH